MSLKKFVMFAATAATLAGVFAPVAAEAAVRQECRLVHVHGHLVRHCWPVSHHWHR